MTRDPRTLPLVLITGAAGGLGSALAEALADEHTVVGLDRDEGDGTLPIVTLDLTDDDSVAEAFDRIAREHGRQVASVIHLAAYFDFTGEPHPLYEKVNVEGTRRVLRALKRFEVEQFVYASTMLVHEPGRPGERIDESQPIAPKWAYPQSKAAAEQVIREERGDTPVVLLRLAGVYDAAHAVPTLVHQIARIYERDVKSYVYAGNPDAGQSMLHQEDMIDAFRRTVERRAELHGVTEILIGEAEAMGYDALQDEIGRLIHGEAEWTTLQLPKPVAKLGAAAQASLEPAVPDAIDHGKKPFIRPFMIEMADDHYALDLSRAQLLLGWQPRHKLRRTLPAMVRALKADPAAWYEHNGLTPPDWVQSAEARGDSAESLRRRHEAARRRDHAGSVWSHWFNIALGGWLIVSPPLWVGSPPAMVASDMIAGAALIVFAALSLSWRLAWARWACAAIGLWLMSAPLLFWAPNAAGYLNDTLVGMLVVGFAVLLPPTPGVSPVAAMTGPDLPPGWSYNPSQWTQRMLVIALAFVGLHISRYLAAFQLGHTDSIWDPFFPGLNDTANGTEAVITSSVSEAWPVSDAGLGALTYAMEILTGALGSHRRWRTMPWLVLLFGLLIVPLGAVSIFFIIIQPIWIGTWCALCLVAAAAMLIQIPYSLDEIVVTLQFLRRRMKAGRPLLAVLLFGDTDEGSARPAPDEFARSPGAVLRDMVSGGVRLTWSLALTMLIGLWLMFTRLTLGAEGGMADADHLIGALAITVSVIACAGVARSVRLANVPLGLALLVTPFVHDVGGTQLVASLLCGVAMVLLSLPRGPITERYGGWNRAIV